MSGCKASQTVGDARKELGGTRLSRYARHFRVDVVLLVVRLIELVAARHDYMRVVVGRQQVVRRRYHEAILERRFRESARLALLLGYQVEKILLPI